MSDAPHGPRSPETPDRPDSPDSLERPDSADTPAPAPIPLCDSAELREGGLAVPFDVRCGGQGLRAFAVRFEGTAHAYLNRCTHVPMELDYQPGRVFDDSGQWLLCATHGAAYQPATGACAGGPCRGGLVKIALTEAGGRVRWQPTAQVRPIGS